MAKSRKFKVTKVVKFEPVVVEIYGDSVKSSKAVALTKSYTRFVNENVSYTITQIK